MEWLSLKLEYISVPKLFYMLNIFCEYLVNLKMLK